MVYKSDLEDEIIAAQCELASQLAVHAVIANLGAMVHRGASLEELAAELIRRGNAAETEEQYVREQLVEARAAYARYLADSD